MSDTTFATLDNDGRQQKYNAMVEMFKKNTSMLPRDDHNHHSSATNSTLGTQQFYNSGSVPPPVQSIHKTSVCPASTVSSFRYPVTVDQFNTWLKYETRVKRMIKGYKVVEDKSILKLFVRIGEEILETYSERPELAAGHNLESSLKNVLEKFYRVAGPIPRHISAPSEQVSVSSFFSIDKNHQSSIATQRHEMLPPLHSQIYLDKNQQSRVETQRHEHEMLPPFHNQIYQPSIVLNKVNSSNFGGNSSGLPPPPPLSIPESRQMDNEPPRDRLPSLGGPFKVNNTAHPFEESSLSLFSEISTLAQIRDENAAMEHPLTRESSRSRLARLNSTQALRKNEQSHLNNSINKKIEEKPGRSMLLNNSKKAEMKTQNKNRTILDQSILPNGAKAVTRTGRLIKSPIQFWKGNDSSKLNDTTATRQKKTKTEDEDDLEESIVLRNKVIVKNNKKKTPPLKNTNKKECNIPLSTIVDSTNNSVLATTNKRKKNTPSSNGKENKIVEKRKHVKKKKENLDTLQSVKTKTKSSKEYKKKSVEPTEQDLKNIGKKEPTKRKIKGNDTAAASKKKKVEEDYLSEDSSVYSVDDLFDACTYRKRPQLTHQALSPSKATSSVKKAAGGAISKETPPCKALGMLMNTTAQSATSSCHRLECPDAKPNQVLKRVVKVIEKNKKRTVKTASNKTKESSDRDNSVKRFNTVTPLSIATLTVSASRESESEDSDSFGEDEDSDLN